MKTKIDPEIWDTIHHLAPETKIAVLWMLTNRGINIAGICSVTKPRFQYETGLDWSQFGRACKAFGSDLYLLPSPSEALTKGLPSPSEALPKGLPSPSEALTKGLPSPSEGSETDGDSILTTTRYWVRSYVRNQVSQDGPDLVKNNVAKAVVRAVTSADSPELIDEFLLKYPSLASFFSSPSSENSQSPSKHLVSPSKGLPSAKRREESNKRGEERHGEEGVQRESQEPHEPSSPENKKPRAPEDIVPAPEVLQRLGPIFGRQKNARASHVEETLALSLHASEEQLALVEAYYRMAVAEPEVFYPKRSLSALLHDFPSQCDRARAHFAGDPLFSPQKNSAAAPEPEGWREVVLAKYPRALVHEYRSWFDLSRDIRREFPQFPEDRHPAKKPASAPEPAVCGPTPAAA
jgi:hypothetical protein